MARRNKKDIRRYISDRLCQDPSSSKPHACAADAIADAILQKAMAGDTGAIKTVMEISAQCVNSQTEKDGTEQEKFDLEIKVVQ